MFHLGDIVKCKDNDDVLYMVVDVLDFTQTASGKEIVDIDLELMQIYPIELMSRSITLSHTDVFIHAKSNGRNHVLLMDFIAKDRARNGWFDIPDYVKAVNDNLRAINEEKNRTEQEKVHVPERKYDTVRYDLLESVDECLDALNDLGLLHEMFGDEAYSQLRDIVFRRLEKLV